jgi:hypothetical protein
LYSDLINAEREVLLNSSNVASIDTLDPVYFSYRPVQGEKLLAVEQSVSRYELKSTGRYAGGAFSLSVPIVKGLRYRAVVGRTASQKQYQITDTGRLVLTDKAVAFEGSEKNERIPWTQIADIEFLLDGYRISKRTGPPRMFSVASPDPRLQRCLIS